MQTYKLLLGQVLGISVSCIAGLHVSHVAHAITAAHAVNGMVGAGGQAHTQPHHYVAACPRPTCYDSYTCS